MHWQAKGIRATGIAAMGIWALGLLASSHLPAQDLPWEKQPFTAPANEVIAAAKALPPPAGASVEVLLFDVRFDYDQQGKKTHQYRRVMRLLDRSALDQWSSITAWWHPWHENKPTIKGRVIRSTGEVFELDPGTLAEVAPESEFNVYSDRRGLRAPLPGIAVGCVVEIEVTIAEHTPFFSAGVREKIDLISMVPTRRMRTTVTAPEDLPLRYRLLGAPIPVVESKADGRQQIRCQLSKPATLRFVPPLLPADSPMWPRLDFSTGGSWQSIASRYGEQIDRRIESRRVADLVKPIRDNAQLDTTLKKVQACHDVVRRRIRYTGLEFGSSAIIPYTPDQTLQRGYGDCKDQATLLVAMLREMGVKAYVALVQIGSWEDAIPELPGLNAFDHAIVYVDDPHPLWVDPTQQFLRVDRIAPWLQGRYALVAKPSTKDLRRMPTLDAAKNHQREIREFHLKPSGRADVVEKLELTGGLASEYRQSYANSSQTELEEAWNSYLRNMYGVDSLKQFEFGDPWDLSRPFAIKVTCDDAPLIAAEVEGGWEITLSPGNVLDRLPDFFVYQPEEDIDQPPRTQPFVLRELFTSELRFIVHLPTGVTLPPLPDPQKISRGPLVIEWDFQSPDASQVVASYRVSTGTGVLTREQAEGLRDDLLKLDTDLSDEWMVKLRFEHSAMRALVDGRYGEATQAFLDLLRDEPESASLHSQMARAVLSMGFGKEARRLARRAVELEPTSRFAEATLANVLIHDELGRHFYPGMDWSGARQAYQRAIELAPEDLTLRWNYAIFLEHDESGRRYVDQDKLKLAREQYKHIRQLVEGAQDLDLNYWLCLKHLGDYRALLRSAREGQPSLDRNALLIAAVAKLNGVNQALSQARRLVRPVADRLTTVSTAAAHLGLMREYALAAKLEAAAKDAVQVEFYEQMKKEDELPLNPLDAVQVTRHFVARLLAGGDNEGQLRRWVSSTVGDDDWQRLKKELDYQFNPISSNIRANDLTPQRAADVATVLEYDASGSAEIGYAVTIQVGSRVVRWYWRQEGDGLKLLGTSDGSHRLAAAAWDALQADNVAAAAEWLSYAAEDREEPLAWFRPFAGTPFGRIWRWCEADDPNQVRAATAALMTEGDGQQPQVAQSCLSDVRDKVTSQQTLQVDRARIVAALLAKDFELARSEAARLMERYGREWSLQRQLMGALERPGQKQALREFAEARLAERADDDLGNLILARMTLRSDPEKSLAYLLKMRCDRMDSEVHGKLVKWLKLETGKDLAPDELLQSDSGLLLSAAIAAEQEEWGEAIENLKLATGDIEQRGDFWFTRGRIAEKLKLNTVAIDSYQRVKPDLDSLLPFYPLARRRLERLQQAESQP